MPLKMIKAFPSFLVLCLAVLIKPHFATDHSVQYQLIINQPQKHLATIQIETPVLGMDTLTISMPAWSPGRYVIYNFAQNVFDLKAFDQNGQPLKTILVDKQTWRVPVRNTRSIQISYRLFANTLDGTFSKIDLKGASINGAATFAYLKELKDRPIQLRIKAPPHWQVVCALDPQSNGPFKASGYDQLIDSPIELGRLFKYRFTVLNTSHFLIFHQPVKPKLLTHFQKDLQKIIRYFANLFGDSLPYSCYTFFFHLTPHLKHPDGMEHANACRVLLRMDLQHVEANANTDPDYDNLIWLSAHEFFHTWNVKRLRPVGLGPFDYSKEVYTPCLWIVEGWTSYYAYLSLLRTGIYTQGKFLSELSNRITRYENSPGKKYRTLTEVSILSWLFKGAVPRYAQTNIDTTTYSYYYKGLIAAFLLDILLRSKAQPASSLDELIKTMWQQFYKQGQSYYYLAGQGYTEQQIEDMIVERLGQTGKTFLSEVVHSTNALPYEIVENAGLKLQVINNTFRLVKKQNPSLGAQNLWKKFTMSEQSHD